MDLTFGKEELAFKQEVRDWLKENFTPEMQGELKVSRNAYLAPRSPHVSLAVPRLSFGDAPATQPWPSSGNSD